MSMGGSGSLMRALGVEVSLSTESGGVPAWADRPEDTRQNLLEIAQRHFKDMLDAVVRFEHEHLTAKTYTQTLVVFAVPTPSNKDIVLGGTREIATRLQDDITGKLEKMGVRANVRIHPDRSFTGGTPVPPVQPVIQSSGPVFGGQGAMTNMHSTGSDGGGGGPVPMLYNNDRERLEALKEAVADRLAASEANAKHIIPPKVYPLLIASAIAGVSLAGNLFFGSRYMSLRADNVQLSQRLDTEVKAEREKYTALDKENSLLQQRFAVFEVEERAGEALKQRAVRLQGQIDALSKAGAKAKDMDAIPELRTAWTDALQKHILLQEAEVRRLEIELGRLQRQAEVRRIQDVYRETPVVPPSSRNVSGSTTP